MTIVAIINQKGGVGKTTVATNLAHALALNNANPILLIDLDPQAHSSLIFGEHDKYNLFINDVFKTKYLGHDYSIAIDKKYNKEIECLYILPSNLQLALISEQLSGRVHREKILFNYIKMLPKDYTVILDCPPNLGLLAINGIYAADHILIPINYGRYALEGMNDLLSVIKEIKEDKFYEYSILRNNYDPRNLQTNRFIEQQLESFGANLFETKIRKCESLNQAQMNGETIFSYDPKSNGAIDFQCLRMEWVA